MTCLARERQNSDLVSGLSYAEASLLPSTPTPGNGFKLRGPEGFAYWGSRLSRGPNTTCRSRMTLPRKKKTEGSIGGSASPSFSSTSAGSAQGMGPATRQPQWEKEPVIPTEGAEGRGCHLKLQQRGIRMQTYSLPSTP